METKFKTSFIPKKPIEAQERPGVVSRRHDGMGVFSLLSVVILLLVIAFGVGVYMYKLSLEQQIKAQFASLEKTRDSFEPEFVDEATRLSDRIRSAREILDSHLSPSVIFALLEEYTLQTVAFENFEFSDGAEGNVKVNASGIASGFASIVLQSDSFGETGFLKDVLFTDLQVDEEDNVGFSFEATVDPKLVLYRRNLQLGEEGNSGNIFDAVESEGVLDFNKSDSDTTAEEEVVTPTTTPKTVTPDNSGITF